MTQLSELATQLWPLTGPADDAAGPAGPLTVDGPRTVLPSVFDVTGLAAASVAAAALAAAGYHAAREERAPAAVRVDTRGAGAAFALEGLFTPDGWKLPEVWDPIAGNYQASDGWIRLHTNYAYHRTAVERVLGLGEQGAGQTVDKASVQAAVSQWKAAELEAAVVAAGGCAAAMHDRDTWLASPPGVAASTAPLLAVTEQPAPAGERGRGAAALPYAGLRVLDLTRVIAGPVGTRFLAAYGADVLRIDPPGFAEVPALLPETTAGKRTASLDLSAADGRAAFERLVAGADVLASGLRADALDRLGYTDEALRALNPALIIASHDAYGWQGPWRERRGFDSLVQLSSGIADAGRVAAGADKPVPLPVQALDHATGYLLAAAIGRALTARLTRGVTSRIRGSLIGTANLLWSLPRPDSEPGGEPAGRLRREDIPLIPARTAWGPAHRVAVPGTVAGVTPELRIDAGPLGRHEPTW